MGTFGRVVWAGLALVIVVSVVEGYDPQLAWILAVLIVLEILLTAPGARAKLTEVVNLIGAKTGVR